MARRGGDLVGKEWVCCASAARTQSTVHGGNCRNCAGDPIPTEDTVYYIRDSVPLAHQKIQLSASTSNRTQQLFWFLDGELIFKGNAGEQYWLTPVKGEHVITCVDAEGRSASRPLHISVF